MLSGAAFQAMLDFLRFAFRMPAPASSTDRVQFGVFELDLQRAELRKNGVQIKLQEQPLKVLQVLIETPAQIVTREQLRQRVWPANTFVEFDQGLYSAMARLRDALGDSSESPRFIETVPRKGYRFIAPVNEIRQSASNPVPQTNSAPAAPHAGVFRRWGVSLLAGLLGGGLLLGIVLTLNILGAREWLRSRTTPIRSIAVLPLQNLSGDPEQEYFADGMTDELITSLAKVGRVQVISRTSVMRYKKTDKPLPQIARELNADAVVEGTVERSGHRVRIRVQLIQADSDRHLWAQSYDRDLQDALLLQSQAASDIVSEIQSSLSPAQKQQLASARRLDPEAHEAYLKGLYFSNKRSVPNFNRSIEYYQKAIAKDPSYALAYAGLAESFFGLYFRHVNPEASREGMVRAALRSAQLDPTLAEAHLELATVREFIDWDWPGADAEYRRAVELNPNSALAHQYYAIFLAWQGRSDEALSEAQRSQDLDPVSPFIRNTYCMDLLFARRFDQAIQKCRETLELDPDFIVGHKNLALAYESKRLFGAAVEEELKAAALEGAPPAVMADIRQAFVKGGVDGFWRRVVRELQPTRDADPYIVAACYVRLKQFDLVFKWLETAYQQHSPLLEQLKRDSTFDSMRSDPRFQALISRLRLQ